jgi:tRNA A37 methylthiotransferase MiaB
MKTFTFVNQSCHRRQEDVARVRRFLLVNGFAESTRLADADLVLLFTCAFCQSKVADMQVEIGRIQSLVKDGCELVVGGCLPKTDGEGLRTVFTGRTIAPTDLGALDQLPGITVRIGEVPELGGDSICAPVPRLSRSTAVKAQLKARALWATAALMQAWPALPLHRVASRLDTGPRMGVFLGSGCPRACSYCGIRFAVGPLRSKPLEEVTGMVAAGLDRGYRKFDLFADSIGDYGIDVGTSLGALLDWVSTSEREFSVGMYDLHPQALTKVFAQTLALCEAGRVHMLYVPLQSGNARILGLMNRPGEAGELVGRLVRLRAHPRVFLQTSVIVGFPSETEAEFDDTLAVLSEVRFHEVLVHFYSDMPNTAASHLPGKIDKATMWRRLARLEGAGIRFDRGTARHEWEMIP